MYVNDYASEIKELASESYSFGGVDAYTEIWDRLQSMKRNGQRRGAGCTSGYFYVIEQLEKFVDTYFNWSGNAHYYSSRTKVIRSRMRNIDTEIERITNAAIRSGVLVPNERRAV